MGLLSLEEKDKKYVWHPFTQMLAYNAVTPLIVESGEGIKLKDIHGREYYDGISSLWVNMHGHRKIEISQAIIEQLEKVAHSTLLGFANVPSIELAEQLVEITPEGLNKVFYSDSGATSVEIALKIAYQYWQNKEGHNTKKKKLVSFTSAYHGDTVGAVSVGHIDLYHKIFQNLLFDSYSALYPYCYRCPLQLNRDECQWECISQLEELLNQNHQNIAALIIEPVVQGASGIIVAPDGHLARVRSLCTKYNVLMIVDEVATGFGRTGKMFACEHEQVKPDIMTLAKGITGGYLPLAATLTTDDIYQAFLGKYKEHKTFYHGHSYTGNQLACAAALANLAIYKKEKVIDNVQEKISFVKNKLRDISRLKHVGDIRQKGLMVGMELVKNQRTKESYAEDELMGAKVCQRAVEKGLIIRPLGDVIVFMPPLASTLNQLNEMLNIIHRSIKEVTE